jgi:hypothetical protein
MSQPWRRHSTHLLLLRGPRHSGCPARGGVNGVDGVLRRADSLVRDGLSALHDADQGLGELALAVQYVLDGIEVATDHGGHVGERGLASAEGLQPVGPVTECGRLASWPRTVALTNDSTGVLIT